LEAVWLSPRNLAFWITTQTDAERDLMRSAPELVSEFRQELLDVGYPAKAVADVGFEFEAQQTVIWISQMPNDIWEFQQR
jgi:hypothetical protein